MKRIIHICSASFYIIALLATFTACNKDNSLPQLQETSPAFAWEENSFLLETDNGWGVTRFNNRIALSNYTLKCQYLLSWNGDMNTGEKADGILKIAEVGKKLQSIPLDKLSIEDIDGMYYSIHFEKGDKMGTLIFSK